MVANIFTPQRLATLQQLVRKALSFRRRRNLGFFAFVRDASRDPSVLGLGMTRISASALLGVLTLLAAFAAPGLALADVAEPTVSEAQAYVDVELDIFSGRPNPRWTVEVNQIAPLLPGSDTPRLDATGNPPGLGYRGFVLTLGSTETGVPTVYHIFAGEVSVGAGDERTSFVDEKGLEAWLLEDARQRGYGDLLEAIAITPLTGATASGQ